MFRGRNWIQYLSSESEDSLDYGYRPRDDENDPNDQVGGGTPWLPPLPTGRLASQTPAIVVMDEGEELRNGGWPHWYRLPSDENIQDRTQALQLYNRRVVATNTSTVVVGHRIKGKPLDVNNLYKFNPGDEKGQRFGLHLRFPYYWDGDPTNKPLPKIKFELPFRIGGTQTPVTFNVVEPTNVGSTTLASFTTTVNTVGIIDIPEHTFVGTQMNSFQPGWNSFKFNIWFTSTAAPILIIAGGPTTNGVSWMCTSVRTSVPIGLNFEFKRQQNWPTTFPGASVRLNADRTLSRPVQNVATEVNTGPLGHTNASNTGISYDTTWFWDVYSCNPDELVAWWWELKTRTIFPFNYESGISVLYNGSTTVGPCGGGVTAEYIMYDRQETSPTQNIPHPAPANGNRIARYNSSPDAISWKPKGEYDAQLSTENTLYMPYNCKALVWLKQGSAVNDTLPP